MVDRYTKAVLTVIAVALTVIAVRGGAGQARAQSFGPTHVVVDSWGAYMATLPIPVQVQR